MPIGLYVHVPFCARKCPYCDFYSLPYRKAAAEEYSNAVLAEMESRQGPAADTLYFGGGTPSLLPPQAIGRIREAAVRYYHLPDSAEVTLEANPNTLHAARLAEYRAAGINRISLGVQSAVPQELRALGRTHSPEQAAQAIRTAFDAGISNISADLMLGIPYQTADSVRDSLRFLTGLPLQHVSAYLLTPEEHTPFWDSPLLRFCAQEDALAGIYHTAADWLERAGFLQYEISNFARPGMESRHNLKYWTCEEYLGFGPAAHSFYGRRRFCHPPDLDRYCAGGWREPQITDTYAAGACPSLEERILLGLRLSRGIPLSWLDELPAEAVRGFRQTASRFQTAGLAAISSGRLALTRRGFLVSNQLLSELLQFVTI